MSLHQQAINIPNVSNGPLPAAAYTSGNREDYLNLVVPLYQASIMGDWETANLMFQRHPHLVRLGITMNLDTPLHVAATAKETEQTLHFVQELVSMMSSEELEDTNRDFNTAFCIACAYGKKQMASIMMNKHPSLRDIRGKDEYLPLSIGAMTGSYHIVELLYRYSQKMSGHHWTDGDRDLTLLCCVQNDMFDVALQILEDCPQLAQNVSLLEVLAHKHRSVMRILQPYGGKGGETKEDNNELKILKKIWGHATRTMNLTEIEDLLRGPPSSLADGTIQYCSRILFIAAEKGNTMFIVMVCKQEQE